MATGHRDARQPKLFVAMAQLASSPGYPFYEQITPAFSWPITVEPLFCKHRPKSAARVG